MLARAFHAHDRHGGVFLKGADDSIFVLGVVVHAGGESAHGERIDVAAEHGHGFL